MSSTTRIFINCLTLFLIFHIQRSHQKETKECRDGVDNVLRVESFGDDNLPVYVKNITILVYDIFYKPSCHQGNVNMVMPGYFKILGGEIFVPRDYDLFDRAIVRATVDLGSMSICDHGKSGMMLVPSRLCHFKVTSWVPGDICELLQKKGKHTLKEMEEKLGFNSTLELPPSPSFLGISLLSVLSGSYQIMIEMEVKGETIVRFTMPSGHKPVQIGL